MEALLGKVSSIEGKFFAEDVNDDVIELKSGDEISEGTTVYGDPSNSASAMITVAMEGSSETVNLSGSNKQLFDNSLANVDEETAAGEENIEGSGDTSGIFAARDGSSTDITAGLRDAQFFTDETRAQEDGILLDNGIPLEEITEPNTVPTVTVDLNVNPNDAQDDAISLTGSSQRAATVTVTITDAEGTVVFTKANIPVDANGNWSVPNDELPNFSEDVTYTATAVSTDSDGDISPEAIDTDVYAYNDITPPVLSMNIELQEQETPSFTPYAYDGDGYNAWINAENYNSAQAQVSFDETLGYGVSNKNPQAQGNGSQTKAVEDNETLLFEVGATDSINVTLNAGDNGGVACFGNWIAYDENRNQVGSGVIELSPNETETLIVNSTNTSGTFNYIVFDAHDSRNTYGDQPGQGNSEHAGFYVDVNSIGGNTVSENYEYTISLDADLDGSSDIPGDLTDITLTGLPIGVTLHDNGDSDPSSTIPVNGDGSYTVVIDDDGQADVTLTSSYALASSEIDSIVSTTDLSMSVTDSESNDTTLSVSNGSIDFSSLVDDHDSLENIDLDNSTNQVASISLDDVLDMTDNSNELSIVGNDGDTLSIDTSSLTHTWTETGSLGNNVFTYENTMGDSITLTVDDQIDVIGA